MIMFNGSGLQTISEGLNIWCRETFECLLNHKWDRQSGIREENLKKKLLTRLTPKLSNLSWGLDNNKTSGTWQTKTAPSSKTRDKHTRAVYGKSPQYQFLNISEIINKSWDGGGNEPRTFLFSWNTFSL